jgi:hypothetical protein
MRKLAFLSLMVPVAASAVTLSLNPKATYLRTNSDPALFAIAYKLSDYGFGAGDTIKFTRVGELDNGNGVILKGLTGVFSGSSTLLASANLNRVPDAIEAGIDFVTSPTFNGALATDIAEDFFIAGNGGFFFTQNVVVPTGAEYVFFSAIDSYFGDNLSSDYGVSMEAVPEPFSIATLGLGLAAVARRRKRAS